MNPTHNLYFVYLLQSIKNRSFYIGCTNNLERRLFEHNHDYSFHTKKYSPWKLVYFEAFSSRKDAYCREKSLKLHAQGLRRLKERLRNCLII